MLQIDFVIPETQSLVFSMQTSSAPNTGDILALPDGMIYRIIQRSYIVELADQRPHLVDLSAPGTQCTVRMQCILQLLADSQEGSEVQ